MIGLGLEHLGLCDGELSLGLLEQSLRRGHILRLWAREKWVQLQPRDTRLLLSLLHGRLGGVAVCLLGTLAHPTADGVSLRMRSPAGVLGLFDLMLPYRDLLSGCWLAGPGELRPRA